MKCSACQAELNEGGYCVECGFSLPKQKPAPNVAPGVPCAHEGCNTSALLRRKTPTGWANLCEFHDMQAHQARANANSARLGLKTPEDHRQWLRANAKRYKRFEDAQPPMREPGQDEEERVL